MGQHLLQVLPHLLFISVYVVCDEGVYGGGGGMEGDLLAILHPLEVSLA